MQTPTQQQPKETRAMEIIAPAPDPALRTDRTAFEPTGARSALWLAETLVAGRLVPETLKTPEAVFTVIVKGRELGLSVMQSLNGIHVIKGKPTLAASTMVALVKGRREVCRYFQLVESTDLCATYETQREGEPKPTRLSWTIGDAKRAGLPEQNPTWSRYPAAMLRARCASILAREVYPDLVQGTYDPDEIREEERDVTPGAEPAQTAPEPAPKPVTTTRRNAAPPEAPLPPPLVAPAAPADAAAPPTPAQTAPEPAPASAPEPAAESSEPAVEADEPAAGAAIRTLRAISTQAELAAAAERLASPTTLFGTRDDMRVRHAYFAARLRVLGKPPPDEFVRRYRAAEAAGAL